MCVWGGGVAPGQIEDSLGRHSCTEALQWCNDNRAKLRKNKSTLEFQLRLQEFVELVRSDQLSGAIQYARKHFPGFMEGHAADVQQVRETADSARGADARAVGAHAVGGDSVLPRHGRGLA